MAKNLALKLNERLWFGNQPLSMQLFFRSGDFPEQHASLNSRSLATPSSSNNAIINCLRTIINCLRTTCAIVYANSGYSLPTMQGIFSISCIWLKMLELYGSYASTITSRFGNHAASVQLFWTVGFSPFLQANWQILMGHECGYSLIFRQSRL